MVQDLSTRQLVAAAHEALFNQHDLAVLERSFAPDFIEHSPLVSDGLAGLASLVKGHPDMRHQAVRVLGDGELVAIHGRYTGLDATPLVGFDIYRVLGERIVEHWDARVPEAEPNASGRTQLDGPTRVESGHDREANRQLVLRFFHEALVHSDYSAFRRYTDGEHFLQHSPDIADGVEAVIEFLQKLEAQGQKLVYRQVHRSIADGQFVLTHSEGSIAGQRHAFCELWRVEQGRIVELWDAIMPVPEDAEARHDKGVFVLPGG